MKHFLTLSFFAVFLISCEKVEDIAPNKVSDPLAEVIRIAQEGAAMLDDCDTRASIGRRIARNRISCKVRPSTRSGELDDTLYYVVNYADDAGFAIISANKRKGNHELLAVTEIGSYAAGEETDNEGFNQLSPLIGGGMVTTMAILQVVYSIWQMHLNMTQITIHQHSISTKTSKLLQESINKNIER